MSTQAVYSELAVAKEPPSLGFGRNSKTERGVGMFYSEKNFLICLDWKLDMGKMGRQAN